MIEREHSPHIVVGRDDELARIDRMIADPAGPWTLFVVAPGGEGKSRLLEAVLEKYRALGHPTSGLFDFFTDGHRTREGVLEELAGRFSLAKHNTFYRHLGSYRKSLIEGDDAGRRKALGDMESALVKALSARFRKRRGLFVVDTVEQISRLRLSDWFFTQFLPRLAPNVVVLAGGRELPERAIEKLRDRCETLHLGGLNLEAVESYLRQVVPGFDGDPEAESLARRIHSLTAGPGQALLMALVAVGLNGGDLAIPAVTPDDLANWTPDALRERLIAGPLLDPTPQGRVLMRLGHFYHGLDVAMLARIDSPWDLGTADYEGFLRGLHDRPYVKYHQDAGVVRLHDYFADQAQDLFATSVDIDLNRRHDWSAQLLDYLEEQIKEIGDAISPRDDRLRQQWLYHLLFADTERAYGELWDVFDRLWHAGRYDYMAVLLAMARSVNETWRKSDHFDPILANLEKSARARMMLEVWEVEREEIVALTDEIIDEKAAGVRSLYLTALVARGTALGDMGRPDDGNRLLRQAFEAQNKLLKVAEAAESGDSTARDALRSEHGIATVHGIRPERYLALNTIGYNERRRSRFRQALEAFEESYALSLAEGDLRWQASAATQIGNARGYLGDTDGALNWLHLGLARRRELGIQDQIAFALAALGKLQFELGRLNEARQSFTDAQEIWRDLDAKRDVTAMDIELGFADLRDGFLDAADKRFKVASETIAKEDGLGGLLPDLRAKQGQSLVKRARLTKDSAERGRWLDEAERYLVEAIKLARLRTQPLYAAISLAALARADEMRDQFERLSKWEAELRAYSAQEYEFGPAFADMEQTLGDVALRRARRTDDEYEYDPAGFDEAVDQYLHMFAHLARHSRLRYEERLEFLREWLPALPTMWRERAGRRLIDGWRALPLDPNSAADEPAAQPGSLAEAFPGFIRTVKIMAEM